MAQVITNTQVSQSQQVRLLIEKAIANLQGISDELSIKTITTKCWTSLEELVPNENTFRKTRKQFRNAIEEAFPSSQEPKSGYYFTSAGKA